MKKVKWTSPDGYIHCRMLPDSEPDESAEMGIPCEPPDINTIDWEGVKRDLHNLLVERELIGMAAVNRAPELLRSAATQVLYKRLIALYQTPLKEESNG
jgi:hypothetical protein